MAQHISENERERMVEFANTPVYERDPDQLLPEPSEDEVGDEDEN